MSAEIPNKEIQRAPQEQFVGPVDHAAKDMLRQPGVTVDDAMSFAIGATLRQGKLESASGSYTHDKVFDSIETSAQAKIADPEDQGPDDKTYLRAIPRVHGIREAFAAIHDQFGGEAVGRMGELSRYLRLGKRAERVLGNINEFAGYLTANPEGYENTSGLDWQGTILHEVESHINRTDKSIPPAWQRETLRGSEIPGQAEKQALWDQSVAEAQRAGVDLEFLVLSAESLRDIKDRVAVDLGNAALGQQVLIERSSQELVNGPPVYK